MAALSRRAVLGVLAGVGLSATACLGKKPPEPSAPEILAKASDALKTVKSVHFKLQAMNGEMVVGGGLPAREIEGDILQPDRIKGTATSTFGKVTVQIGFTVIGTQEYVTNPISKKWQKVPGAVTTPNLLDPSQGASAILRKATDLKKLADEAVDGVACYHVSGQLAGTLVAGLIGSPGLAKPLAGEVWIGQSDLLVRRLRLVGPITADEPPAIQRTLTLSRFNESITIDPPE